MRQYETAHLVKQEDLNHHGTLFAARAAAWFVEAAFVAAGCECGTSEGIVCRNLHDMSFYRPVQKGTIMRFLARVVFVGKSSFMVAVTAMNGLTEEINIEGMLTFVVTDGHGGKSQCPVVMDEPGDDREREQREAAEIIKKRQFDRADK